MHHHILWSGPLGRITGQVTVENMYCYFYTRNIWKSMSHQAEAMVRADNGKYLLLLCALYMCVLCNPNRHPIENPIKTYSKPAVTDLTPTSLKRPVGCNAKQGMWLIQTVKVTLQWWDWLTWTTKGGQAFCWVIFYSPLKSDMQHCLFKGWMLAMLLCLWAEISFFYCNIQLRGQDETHEDRNFKNTRPWHQRSPMETRWKLHKGDET